MSTKTPKPLLALALAVALIGCQRGPYTSVSECEELPAGQRQDACWLEVLPPLFRDRAQEAEGLVNTRVQDPQVRDYIWLTVTRDIDPSTAKYCNRIENAAMKERCRVLVSRPHLHREMSGAQPAPGGAGGGPQGKTAPPGP